MRDKQQNATSFASDKFGAMFRDTLKLGTVFISHVVRMLSFH